VAAASHDSLRLSLELPAEVDAGEPVAFVFRVENVSGRTLDLYLRGRTIAFDVIVTRPDGAAVWRRLEGEIIPAILRIETLAPDEALELADTWLQRSDAGDAVPPGEYRVHAELLTESEPLRSAALPLRIRGD
jgi:hypothetical protein